MDESAKIVQQLEARVGSILAGKYRIDRLLGVGGMGAVFEAVNTWTERRVALKLLIGTRVNDTDVVARFLREARAAAKIQHPNIVDVLDMGQDPEDGTLYIVQEFLTGNDLARVLADRGRVMPREAFEYLVPLMSALVAAHEQGIIHRDLKPGNMFIVKAASGAVPKLIDFGIAKVSSPGHLGLTRTGETMGTPYYMSPEQARGEKDIGAQTDVWAMGVVWYEMLSGRCPFEGDSYNALLAQILTETVPPIRSFVPDVPPALEAVIHGALARDRRARYADMKCFLQAVLQCGEYRDTDWLRNLRSRYAAAAGLEEYDEEAPTQLVPTLDPAATGGVSPVPSDQAITPRLLATTTSRTPRVLDVAAPSGTEYSRRNVWIAIGALVLIGGVSAVALRRTHSANPPQAASLRNPAAGVTANPVVPVNSAARVFPTPAPSRDPASNTATQTSAATGPNALQTANVVNPTPLPVNSSNARPAPTLTTRRTDPVRALPARPAVAGDAGIANGSRPSTATHQNVPSRSEPAGHPAHPPDTSAPLRPRRDFGP